MDRHAQPVEKNKVRFVRYMRNMRVLGLALGGLCIASVLFENGADGWLWCVLAAEAIAWPHLAYLRARRASDPIGVEFGNLAFDAASGGFWVAAMGGNLLASALVLSMLWIGEVGTGGRRFLWRCVALQATAAALAWGVFGFPLSLETTTTTVIASVPFLVAYPLALSLLVRGLNEKVQRQKRLLERLVSTDGLTGLANRQHWEWWVERQLARLAQGRGPAALMMIDVDHFKQVNDTWGHLLGDEVITTVAQALRSTLRADDVAGRYAGDEFAVVMPDTDAEAARALAEKFRERVAALRFPGAPALRITMSIGIAVEHHGDASMNAWIHDADGAMYESKRAGRDRVSVAGATSVLPPGPVKLRLVTH